MRTGNFLLDLLHIPLQHTEQFLKVLSRAPLADMWISPGHRGSVSYITTTGNSQMFS